MRLRFKFKKRDTNEKYTFIIDDLEDQDPESVILRPYLKELARRLAIKMKKTSKETFAVLRKDFITLEVQKDGD